MLTLSRDTGQSVVLYTSDGELLVTLKTLKNGRLALSFDVPDCVKVLREELVVPVDEV